MSKWEGAPELILALGPQISLNGPGLVASCQQTCCKLIISTDLLELVSTSCRKSGNDRLVATCKCCLTCATY